MPSINNPDVVGAINTSSSNNKRNTNSTTISNNNNNDSVLLSDRFRLGNDFVKQRHAEDEEGSSTTSKDNDTRKIKTNTIRSDSQRITTTPRIEANRKDNKISRRSWSPNSSSTEVTSTTDFSSSFTRAENNNNSNTNDHKNKRNKDNNKNNKNKETREEALELYSPSFGNMDDSTSFSSPNFVDHNYPFGEEEIKHDTTTTNYANLFPFGEEDIKHDTTATKYDNTDNADRLADPITAPWVLRESEYDAFVEGSVLSGECEFEYSISEFQASNFRKEMEQDLQLQQQQGLQQQGLQQQEGTQDHQGRDRTDRQETQFENNINNNTAGNNKIELLTTEEIYWDEERNQEVQLHRSGSLHSNNDSSFSIHNSSSEWSNSFDGNHPSFDDRPSFNDDENNHDLNSQESYTWDERERVGNRIRTHSADNTPDVYPFPSPLGLASSRSSNDDDLNSPSNINNVNNNNNTNTKQQRRSNSGNNLDLLQQPSQPSRHHSVPKPEQLRSNRKNFETNLSSPTTTTTRGKKSNRRPLVTPSRQYHETNTTTNKQVKRLQQRDITSPRNRLVAKVFGSRRSRVPYSRSGTNKRGGLTRTNSSSHLLEPTPEEEEARVVLETSSHKRLDFAHVGSQDDRDDNNEGYVTNYHNIGGYHQEDENDNKSCSSLEAPTGPIDYIKTANFAHDLVSQITMQKDDFLSPTNREENLWWWTSDNAAGGGGIQGWLPAIVADIAEDFIAKPNKRRSKSCNNSGDITFPESDDDSDPFEDLSDNDQGGGSSGTSNRGDQTDIDQSDIGLNSVSYIAGDTTDLSAYRNNHEQPKSEGCKPHVEDIVHDVSTDRWKKKVDPSSSKKAKSKKTNKNPRVAAQIRKLEHNMEVQNVELGHYHPRVAASLVAIGVLRVENGEPDLAIDAILEALKIQKARRDPRSMARSLHVLADIYGRHLKEYDLAMSCYQDVQHIERRLYGPDHPENAHTLNRMGRVHASRSQFYEAMEKHQQALKVLKACVGEDPNHPAVSQTLIFIGEVYYQERNSLDTIISNSGKDDYTSFLQTGMIDIIAHAHDSRGNYKKALGFLEEKLQLISSVKDFPQDHLASILNSLGTLSCKSGVFMEAIDYYQQALDIQMRHGCTEVDVATAKVLIGTVEYQLGQYHKALKLLEGALNVFQREFGSHHEVVADTLHRIGLVKGALWYHVGSKESLESALDMQYQLFGPEDLSILQTHLALIWIELNQGEMDHDIAVREVKSILTKQEAAIGNKAHPILADTLLLLAKVYLLNYTSSNEKTAFRLLRESFQMREQFLGRDHPLQADTFYWIAVEGIRHHSKHQHGLNMFMSVLRVRTETLGERHVDVAAVLGMIGRCHAGLGATEEASKCLNEALEMAMESIGPNHPSLGEIYIGIGLLEMRQCHFDKARESIQKAIDIYNSVDMSLSHTLRKEAEECLERVERDEMLCV